MIDDGVPQRLRDAIGRELVSGERLAWLGQPRPGLVRWVIAWSIFIMGLVGLAYAIPVVSAGARGEWQPTGKPIPAVWGVLIASGHVLAMLGFMTTPLKVHWSARSVAYVITNRRVLVMRRGLLGAMDRESIPAASLDLAVKPYRDGIRGDIALVAKGSADREREDMFRFIALSDVHATEAALRRLIQSSSNSSL